MIKSNQAKMSTDSGANVRFTGDIAIVELTGYEKRFSLSYLATLNKAYDEVLRNEDAKAVVTISSGKYFSNGFDLPWLAQQNSETRSEFMREYCKLMARVMTFPLPSVAAINGHAFAGGGFLSLAHDYRVMRTERGWWCLNEIHIKLMIPEFLHALVRAKIPNGVTATDVVAFGKRFTGEEALKAALVQEVCDINDLEKTAVRMAKSLLPQGNGFDRDALHQMKSDLYNDAISRVHRIWPPGQAPTNAKL